MNESKIEIMEKMPVHKAILTLAIPAMLANIVQLVYNLTDTFFIGQTGDTNMVAAVSLAMPIFFLIQAFGNIFALGGASYISRKLGEKNLREARHTSSTSFYTSIIIGAVLTAILLVFMDKIIGVIGTSANTFEFARDYSAIISASSIILILKVALSGLIRSEGATKEAMIGILIGTGLNVILDPIFILVLDMGTAGAAWATVIGNFFGVLYYLLYFFGKKTMLTISLKEFKPTKIIYSEISKIGIPASVSQLVMTISFVIVNIFASTYGDNVVAAYGIGMRIFSMLIMIVMGLAQGYQPFAGYSYGAKNYKRFIDGFKITISYSTILCIIFTIIFVFFGGGLFAVFINDQTVIEKGVKMLQAFTWCVPFIGLQFTLMVTFQATGMALKSMLVGLGRQFIIYLPLLFILNYMFGFNGFIFAQPVADIVTTVLAVILSISLIRKTRVKIGQDLPALEY
jgi:multidrug efflux pump